jgi:hypothetical protein
LAFDDRSDKAYFPVMIGCIWFNGHDIENLFVDANEMVKIGRDIGHQIGDHFNDTVKMATIGRDAKRLVKCHARAQRFPQALAFSSKGEKLLDNDWRAGYAGLFEFWNSVGDLSCSREYGLHPEGVLRADWQTPANVICSTKRAVQVMLVKLRWDGQRYIFTGTRHQFLI